MARVKADNLIPQTTLGYHGAIEAIAGKALERDDIVVVVGTRGDRLIVDKTHCSSERLTTGPFFVVAHDAPNGQMVRCLSYKLIRDVEISAKEGALAYAGLDGTWTFKTPKANATCVGKVISTDEGKALLLAPGLM
tara:strand:+ start:27131 stop:27538 length:408 start_codon:yes stop_codon:yes gene_type:complete